MDSDPRRAFPAIALLAAMAWTMAGCSRVPPTMPGALTFLIEASPGSLDPRIGTDAQSEHLHDLLFSSLVGRDAQMNIVPDLAERWETPDPRTYVFHLRPGVTFHDGRPLTSADVKFTIDSILSGAVPSPKRGNFLVIQSIEAPDAATVIIHLREPDASFLWVLSRPALGIVPNGSGSEMAQHPMGTGPFRFVSMEEDENVVLERNPNYFGTKSKVERVVFRIVPDAIVRALELRKGTADVGGISSLTPDMVVTLAKNAGLIVDDQPGTQLAYISFNFDDPIAGRREVRQALAYATDRQTMIRSLLRGQARAAASLLPPNHWAFEAEAEQYDYDPAKAEELLDRAGYPRDKNGVRFHLELKTSTDESTRLLSEALADEWKRVGVALDLRPLETATFYSDISRGSFQLYTFRWVGGNNDPDIFEYVFSSKRFPPLGANRGHYRNAALDALLAQQHAETDREKRKAILSEVQKVIAADEPYINLWYQDNVCVHRSRVTNVVLSPTGDYGFLETVALKD